MAVTLHGAQAPVNTKPLTRDPPKAHNPVRMTTPFVAGPAQANDTYSGIDAILDLGVVRARIDDPTLDALLHRVQQYLYVIGPAERVAIEHVTQPPRIVALECEPLESQLGDHPPIDATILEYRDLRPSSVTPVHHEPCGCILVVDTGRCVFARSDCPGHHAGHSYPQTAR